MNWQHLTDSLGNFVTLCRKLLLQGRCRRSTEEGAKLLDVTGKLKAGIPMCPPEGDAGTGMVATNSVAVQKVTFQRTPYLP